MAIDKSAKIKSVQQIHDMCCVTATIVPPIVTITGGETTFTVAGGGVARIGDNYTKPLIPTPYDIHIPEQIDVVPIYLGTGLPATFLKIDADGNTTQDYLGSMPYDRKTHAVYGYLDHLNSAIIKHAGGLTQGNPNANLAGDMAAGFSSIKMLNGPGILPNGTDLQIKLEAGIAIVGGSNISNSYVEQNYLSWVASAPVESIEYTFNLLGGGFGFHEITGPAVIVPDKWDDPANPATDWATLPTVPSGKWGTHRIFVVVDPESHTTKVVIHLPQFMHSSYTNAINFFMLEPFTANPQAYLGLHLTDITVNDSTTDLSVGLGSLPGPEALFRQRYKSETGY